MRGGDLRAASEMPEGSEGVLGSWRRRTFAVVWEGSDD